MVPGLTQPPGTPGSFRDRTNVVAINIAGSYRISLTAASSVAALTIGDPGAALVIADPGGTNNFAGDLTNAGFLGIDSDSFSTEGGSRSPSPAR